MDETSEPAPPPPADLARAFAVARQPWPDLDLGLELFAEDLRRRALAPDAVPADVLQDLFLAGACARNLPGAVARFRDRFLPEVAAAVKTFDDSPAFADDVFQRLSEVLFVGGGAGPDARSLPRIGSYSGQGRLVGFVRTAARRIALRMEGAAARFQGESALVELLSQAHGQETSILRRQYRDVFNRALSVGLRELSKRERLLLRLNVAEHVSTTRLATMYKVSQPTVSRWLQRAARSIFGTVKELVCDELDIDTREMESMLLLVRSQIEITISQAASGGSTALSE